MIGLTWLACAGAEPMVVPLDPPPAPVERVERSRGAVGVVVPRAEVVLTSDVGGVLVAVARPGGSRVAAGDAVGTLEAPELADRVSAAAEDVAAAESALAVAREEVEQLGRERDVEQALAAAGVRSERDRAAAALAFERGVAAERAARAAVAERRAERDGWRARATGALVAPASGTVADWRFAVGERVPAGAAIVRILDLERLSVRFAVDPSASPEVGQGVRVVATTGAEGRGVVRWVSPEVDRASQTVFAEAELDPGAALLAGMDCRVSPDPP